MINIIKTAIITIIISFASGLLLDYFTNLGPRILCNVRSIIPKGMNSKENCAYIITVKNPSKKTIHELTINIQSLQADLKSTDFKITKGLKFDSSINDNILEVYIPFLSKGDNFSVTVCADNEAAVHSKPVVVIRSPENFKEIDSSEQKGILSSLFNLPKNINQVTGNKKLSKSKKAMIIIALIIVLVAIAGVTEKFFFSGTPNNSSTPIVKNTVSNQSTDGSGSNGTSGAGGSAAGTNGTTDTKASGTGANTSSGGSGTGANTSTGGSGAGANTSTGGSGTGVSTNTSTGGSGSPAATNTSTGGSGTAGANTSTGGSGSPAGANTSTGAGTGGTGSGTTTTNGTTAK